jgi:hypothetical protein
MAGLTVELLPNRLVHTQRLQFLNEALWKISPKSPEVPLPCSTKKKTRGGSSASGLVDQQKPRVGIVDEQRLDVHGYQLLISEQVFSPYTVYVIGLMPTVSGGPHATDTHT